MNTGMRTGKPIVTLTLSICLLCACGGKTGPGRTFFLPPTAANNPAPVVASQTASQQAGPSPTAACTDGLHFLQDLTIPDNTTVSPGAALDKQWQVENNGTCNWDSRYRLRFIGGDPLGAPAEQALYPARSGTQVAIRIVFTAPAAAGNYYSEWQAYDPQGIPFGDSFFIKITVNP